MQNTNIQSIILSTLANHQDGAHSLLPHLKLEYFESDIERHTFTIISNYINEYHKVPPKEALLISADKLSVQETTYQSIKSLIADIYTQDAKAVYEKNREWVIKEAEKFCQQRSINNALIKCVTILEGKSVDGKKYDQGAIPKIMQDALNISFNPSIGHDYIEDADSRYNFYHLKQNQIKSGIDMFDHITGGGFAEKTLNIFMLPTGVGKTTIMCSLASHMLMTGTNVLYITCEMSSERIAERIDANLLNHTTGNLKMLPYDTYMNKIQSLRDTTSGKLIIKEYPPGICNSNHIRTLLNDLKLKKNFIPSVLFVDYLALLSSAYMKHKDNMYNYVKSLAEELRAVCVDYGLVGISGAQTNRNGQNDTDLELDSMSECLHPDTKVLEYTKGVIKLSEVNPGDRILSNRGYTSVMIRHCPKKKRMMKIKTKSGKEIICSVDHQFPTSKGRISISEGLGVGSKINISDK